MLADEVIVATATAAAISDWRNIGFSCLSSRKDVSGSMADSYSGPLYFARWRMDRGLCWQIHTPSIAKQGTVCPRIFLICSARLGLPAAPLSPRPCFNDSVTNFE
jgi:hypothetical protein